MSNRPTPAEALRSIIDHINEDHAEPQSDRAKVAYFRRKLAQLLLIAQAAQS